MPSIQINDFSKGWCPSDNATNGRKDALLQMTALDLEENGIVRMTGGTEVISTYPTTAHTIYSANFGGTTLRYAALTNGDVYRNEVLIAGPTTGTARAGFGKAFDNTLIFSGRHRVQDNGITTTDIALPTPILAPLSAEVAIGNLHDMDGIYQWKIVYVNRSESNIRRSRNSPASIELTVSPFGSIKISFLNPLTLGYAFNEVWVYRRGGQLDAFYKVFEINDFSTYGSTIEFFDAANDVDALSFGERLNEYIYSVNTVDTPEAIIEVVGPINGRHIYFTASSALITERNSPSGYDIRNVINITASVGEVFHFARQINDNTVIIGTSHNLYSLSGTFNDLPDGFIDIYFTALGIEEKPLSRGCCVYGGAVIYLSQAGWQLYNYANNSAELLVAPNTDRLYNYEDCHGYSHALIVPGGGFIYSCAVANGRLYVNVWTSDGSRLECYDFSRRYWRPLSYKSDLLFAEDDGTLIGFNSSDSKLRELDIKTSTLIDGASQQAIALKTVFYDGQTPRHRKDTQAFKFKVFTGGSDLTVRLYTNDNEVSHIKEAVVASTTLMEFSIDVSNVIAKSYQVKMSGSLADFKLADISFTYDLRPEALNFLRIPPTNFGSPARKYLPTFPFVLDTLGNEVHLEVKGDLGGTLGTYSFAGPQKQTWNMQLLNSSTAVDFEFIFSCPFGEFEFYELLTSKFIEVFPEELRFYRSPSTNFGSLEEKVIVVWPIEIYTFGTNVTFKAYANNTQIVSTQFNTTYRKSMFFVADAPVLSGNDFFIELIATPTTGRFELANIGAPKIVRTYPLKTTYDLITAAELVRFGKLRKFEVRLVADYELPIEVTITFSNGPAYSKSITPLANVEEVYTIDVPKTIAGRILKVEFSGGANYFRRISTRILSAVSDNETELKWQEL